MAGHLIKRHNVKAFLVIFYIKLFTSINRKLHFADGYNTFDWLMDVSEKNNLKISFYFIFGRTDTVYDADYQPQHMAIRKFMR
ncbi:hypothetical protein ARAF_1614 [Arsenophonus endosymbiont of Aleurodicus floccissimus]|uniref:hypothetical protein n=1 Tax=Arsenophonus endosymbiont of Aleurodicus floccissimus TaxID=2152761 RepID=UPI000EDB2514|nr:hypothetical protein [Arsenophonus endosymbiont of Aleurodicus floccissimus]SPP31946.1 hypothetical protein ARAF_1614 [Arsenophonus endosymbiont of Aleurodicus floccissimus]